MTRDEKWYRELYDDFDANARQRRASALKRLAVLLRDRDALRELDEATAALDVKETKKVRVCIGARECIRMCVGSVLTDTNVCVCVCVCVCLCAHACDMNIRLVMGHGAFCAGACAKLSIRRRTNSTMRRKQQQQQQRQQQQQQQAVEARERRQRREQNLAPFSKMNGWTTSRNCWIAHTCLLRDGDAVSWLLRANSSTTAVPCSFMREAI